MSGKRKHVLRGLLIILSATEVCSAQTEFRYAIIELPKPNGESTLGKGMDDSGNVVGSMQEIGLYIAPTLWLPGNGPIQLPTFGGVYGSAYDINESGEIAGSATFPGGGVYDEQAALWRNGQVINLGTLGGEDSEALAINDLGEIVGWSETEPGVIGKFPFIRRDGSMQQLRDPGNGGWGWANGLNNTGLIVGLFAGRAMLWENEGPPLDLGTLRPDGRGESVARDVNDAGYVVGGADIDSSKTNAFIWYGGTMTDIGRLPNRKYAWARAINNHNQVVGWSASQPPNLDAFYWTQNTGLRPLADLLPPKTTWRLYDAWDINDAGQICGGGTLRHTYGPFDAFLMTPVHPTMNLAAPSPGTAGVANTITISGVTPGARVAFMYSLHGGGTRIDGCDLQQNALQLDNPKLIGTAVANGGGVASITRTVPPVAQNQTVLFQAVVQNECAISQLVVHRFE